MVCGLAGWRLASLLVTEPGPWDIFARLRARVGVPEFGEIQSGFLPGIFSCMWCMTVWTTALAWASWELHWGIPGVIAAMGTAMVAEQLRR